MTDKAEFGAQMQKIADLIVPNLPDDAWEKTCIVFDDYGQGAYCISSYCLVNGNKTPVEFPEEDSDSLAELFRDIQQQCHRTWKRAQFDLDSDGDCEMNFVY